MLSGNFAILGQAGAMLILLVVGIVVVLVLGSGTSIGRAMLPRPVTDVVAKLMPWSRITDASATTSRELKLRITGNARFRTVHVRRVADMTIAWTFDPGVRIAQSGTYALVQCRFTMKSADEQASDRFKVQVRQALNDALTPKQFHDSDSQEANLLVSVFGAMEDEISVEDLATALGRPHDPEWEAAVNKALKHDAGRNVTTMARGSILLDLVDSHSENVVWHAAAIADVIVNVSQEERIRRTRQAILEMLRKFPPKET